MSFGIGARFLVNGDISIQAVITCLMAVIISSFSLGNVAPNVQAIRFVFP